MCVPLTLRPALEVLPQLAMVLGDHFARAHPREQREQPPLPSRLEVHLDRQPRPASRCRAVRGSQSPTGRTGPFVPRNATRGVVLVDLERDVTGATWHSARVCHARADAIGPSVSTRVLTIWSCHPPCRLRSSIGATTPSGLRSISMLSTMASTFPPSAPTPDGASITLRARRASRRSRGRPPRAAR